MSSQRKAVNALTEAHTGLLRAVLGLKALGVRFDYQGVSEALSVISEAIENVGPLDDRTMPSDKGSPCPRCGQPGEGWHLSRWNEMTQVCRRCSAEEEQIGLNRRALHPLHGARPWAAYRGRGGR